jgi:hypothetical protein
MRGFKAASEDILRKIVKLPRKVAMHITTILCRAKNDDVHYLIKWMTSYPSTRNIQGFFGSIYVDVLPPFRVGNKLASPPIVINPSPIRIL